MSTPAREQQLLASLQQSATVIKNLKAQLRAFNEPIAIIGMGCRFPGHSNNPEQFWQMLAQGVDAVVAMPEERRSRPADDPNRPPCYGGFLDEVATFDPAFFGISPRETNLMDPQQRLLLEVSWEALEAAAIVPETLFKSNSGVFVGMCSAEYGAVTQLPPLLSPQDELHRLTGMSQSVAAGRLSYWFGFTGPAMVVDTACSSSLVTIHQACQSLRQRECDLALAGGVNLLLTDHWAAFEGDEDRMLAWDGRCKTFDAAANGFGRGEGCGMVVLKRLSDAQVDGNRILAVIRGSMVNQDGRSSGLSAPSGPSQQRVIRQALQKAEVEPDQVSYIEAHGTGTRLGDPIEIGALNAVFSQRAEPLWVGSVKTNFGHLEGAAGIAGLIKIILSFQHGQLPPHLNFHQPNPYIDWADSPVRVPITLQPWAVTPKIAGVSSFGISGTNAHIVLEEAPQEGQRTADRSQRTAARSHHLLTLSAKTESALRAYVQRYLDFLTAHPTVDLGDLCYTSQVGRTHFAHRLSLTATSRPELQEHCRTYLKASTGQENAALRQGVVTAQQPTPPIAFLFTGQGAQYVDMGRELYETAPTFRAALDQCEALYQAETGESLLAVLYPATTDDRRLTTAAPRGQQATADERSSLDETTYTQPALFALEYALATLWQSWGVQPTLLLGHSVGEITAACIAGVFSLEDGIKLIAARGRLMGVLPQDGAMIAVTIDEAQAQRLIAPYADRVSIAAVNGLQNLVLSGQRDAIDAITAVLTAADAGSAIQNRAQGAPAKIKNLNVSHAFHSPLMEPMLNAFRQVAQRITYHAPRLPLISNVTGKLAGAEMTTPDYWVRHVREAVRFADGVTTLQAQGIEILLEIGPQPVLLGMAAANYELRMTNYAVDATNNALVTRNSKLVTLPSLRQHHPAWQQMLTSLGELYGLGVAIDWAQVHKGEPHTTIDLPTYPFQRQRYWLDTPKPAMQGALRPMIDHMARLPLHDEILLEIEFSEARLPFLIDHQFYGLMVSPAACQLSIALSAAELIFGQGQGLQVEDFILPQALSLFKGEVRAVQAIFTPADHLTNHEANQSSKQAFKFISFEPMAETPTPVSHGTGYIAAQPVTSPPVFDIAALRQRCTVAIDLSAYYGAMTPTLTYIGPCFRWISELWRSANETTVEAFARLTLPQPIGAVAGHLLHPGLLDGCFQVAALADTHGAQGENVSVLFAVKTIRLYRSAQGSSWWCHASKGALNRWDIALFDEEGQLFATFEQVEIREATPEAIRGKEIWRNWLYHVDWRPLPATLTTGAPPVTAPVPAGIYSHLLLADRQGVGVRLATQLKAAGAQPLLVFADTPTEAALALGAGYPLATVGLENAQSYSELLNNLAPSPILVHLWSLDVTPPTTNDNLVDATQDSCGSALQLVQALLRQGCTPAALWFVTQGAQAVNADDAVAGFAQAPIWGLVKTLALEHPELHSGCIDLDGALANEAQATHLYMEIANTAPPAERETQVALRRAERYGARLAAYQPDATAARPVTITAAATYLITGGLGDLGLVMAQWLAAQGARRLLLVGRSQPTPEAQAALTALQEQGVTVITLQADVTDWAQISALQTHLDAAYPLRGIIHAAGRVDDGIVLQQQWARFASVLAPKLLGAWHLYCLVQHLQTTQPQTLALDFWVAFSSITSLLGNRGQANYAAANAFLDAFAHYQRAQGLAALSINWGAWVGADGALGMAARVGEAQHQQRAQIGIGALTPQQAVDALAYLLKQPVAQVGVTPVHWPKFQSQLTPAPRFYTDFLAQAGPDAVPLHNIRQQLLAAHEEKRAAEFLLDYLQHAVAQILGMADPEQIDPQQGLLDIGLDSLMAVELRNRLSNALAAQLPSTLIFDYPTLAKLSAYLLQELLPPAVVQTTVQEANTALPSASPPTDQTLATLSAAEIASIEDELDLLNEFLTTPRRTGRR